MSKVITVKNAEDFVLKINDEILMDMEKFLNLLSQRNIKFEVSESIRNYKQIRHDIDFKIKKQLDNLTCIIDGNFIYHVKKRDLKMGLLCEIHYKDNIYNITIRYLYGFNEEDKKYFEKIKKIILKVLSKNYRNVIIKSFKKYQGEIIHYIYGR